jgi:hypothetical protein
LIRFELLIFQDHDEDDEDAGYTQIAYTDEGVGPEVRYDFTHCIDGIQNLGEIGVDCGKDSGCGFCEEGSLDVDDVCDRNADCNPKKAQGGCQPNGDGVKVCLDREGLPYSGADAGSCQEVLDQGGTENGLYLIKNGNFPDGLYWCEQNKANGGWMLHAKIPNKQDACWHYDGACWPSDDSSQLGRNRAPETRDEYTQPGWDHVSPAWNKQGFTQVMFALAAPEHFRVRNVGATNKMWDIVNGQTNWKGPGRDFFWSWMKDAISSTACNWQPHCNANGWNMRVSSNGCRFGWSGNNENQCSSNDSAMGFGCFSQHAGKVAAGFTCNNGDVNGPKNTGGWILVR